MIPAWLARRYGDAFRNAGLHPCPRCKKPILSGLDDDNAARTAHADPTPINPVGEAIALLSGRATFDLTSTNGKKQLWRRDQWHIGRRRTHPVLPEHRCGQPLDAHTEHLPPAARYAIPDQPPF